MKTTRVTFFLLAFFITTMANAQRGNMNPEDMAKRNTDTMKERLALSNEQVKKVEVINLEASKKTMAIFEAAEGDRQAMREEMIAVNEIRDKELKPILTENQWEEYLKMKEEQAERRRQRMN